MMTIEEKLNLNRFVKKQIDCHISDYALKNPDKLAKEELFFVVDQIKGRQKAKLKLPSLASDFTCIFPPSLSVEQATAEEVADFKASLFEGISFIDLTGGMGVDTLAFSKRFDSCIYIEQNTEVFKAFQSKNNKNVQAYHADSLAFIKETNRTFDLVYIDPARRDEHKTKVFLLEDCQPNLKELLPYLRPKADKVLIKLSPLIDISSIIKAFEHISSVYVIALKNEVKEVLALIENHTGEPEIHAINILHNKIDFFKGKIETIEATYALPKKYLYEPNAAILKSGLFNLVSTKFKIEKLAPSSHLYTSELLVDFPGRTFEIVRVSSVNENIKKLMNIDKANISVRNFPLSADELKKKLGLKDGGDFYIFGTKDVNKKNILIICIKIH